MTQIKNGKFSEEIKILSKLYEKLEELFEGNKLNDALIAVDYLLRRQKKWKVNNNGYVPICRSTIKRFLPDPRNKIFQKLVDHNIVQVYIYDDGTQYKIHKECKKYRINPDYRGRFKTYTVWHSYVNKKIEKKTFDNIRDLKIHIPQDLTLEEFSRKVMQPIDKKISVDYKTKTLWYKDKKVKVPKEKKVSDEEFKEFVEEFKLEKIEEIVENTKSTIEKIKSGDIPFPKTAFSDTRLHSIVTRMPSPLLEYATLGSEPIYEADLANAQFCLLANYMLNPENPILKKHMYIPRECKECEEQTSPISFIPHPIDSIDQIIETPDIQLFLKTALNGTLYKTFAKKLGHPNTDKIKKLFMGLAFGKLTKIKETRDEIAFRKKFPNLFGFIAALKMYYAHVFYTTDDNDLLRLQYTGKRRKGRFEAGNNYLPIALQRCEVEIFIHRILKRIYENHSGLSKHDAILYKKSEAKEIEKIIQEEIDNALGEGKYRMRFEKRTAISTPVVEDSTLQKQELNNQVPGQTQNTEKESHQPRQSKPGKKKVRLTNRLGCGNQ